MDGYFLEPKLEHQTHCQERLQVSEVDQENLEVSAEVGL